MHSPKHWKDRVKAFTEIAESVKYAIYCTDLGLECVSIEVLTLDLCNWDLLLPM